MSYIGGTGGTGGTGEFEEAGCFRSGGDGEVACARVSLCYG
jgi:hypothetical protein